MDPVSQHTPLFAGGIESVTGSLEVDTGLRDIRTAVATMINTVVADEEAIVSWKQTGGPGVDDRRSAYITLYVWKHAANTGVAGDSAVNVSWMALGK